MHRIVDAIFLSNIKRIASNGCGDDFVCNWKINENSANSQFGLVVWYFHFSEALKFAFFRLILHFVCRWRCQCGCVRRKNGKNVKQNRLKMAATASLNELKSVYM